MDANVKKALASKGVSIPVISEEDLEQDKTSITSWEEGTHANYG